MLIKNKKGTDPYEVQTMKNLDEVVLETAFRQNAMFKANRAAEEIQRQKRWQKLIEFSEPQVFDLREKESRNIKCHSEQYF